VWDRPSPEDCLGSLVSLPGLWSPEAECLLRSLSSRVLWRHAGYLLDQSLSVFSGVLHVVWENNHVQRRARASPINKVPRKRTKRGCRRRWWISMARKRATQQFGDLLAWLPACIGGGSTRPLASFRSLLVVRCRSPVAKPRISFDVSRDPGDGDVGPTASFSFPNALMSFSQPSQFCSQSFCQIRSIASTLAALCARTKYRHVVQKGILLVVTNEAHVPVQVSNAMNVSPKKTPPVLPGDRTDLSGLLLWRAVHVLRLALCSLQPAPITDWLNNRDKGLRIYCFTGEPSGAQTTNHVVVVVKADLNFQLGPDPNPRQAK